MHRGTAFIDDLAERLGRALPGDDAHARFSPRSPTGEALLRDAPDDARQAAALILLYPNERQARGPEGPRLRQAPERQPRRHENPGPQQALVAGDLQVPGSPDSYSIPLTVRHADLPQHGGQISLPGGRIDPGETAEAAALREAAEEIGVDPASVRILGSLTPVVVLVSRFVITPFIGVAATRPDFRLAEREVAELLEVSVDQLRDRDNLHWGSRTREGYVVDFPYFRLGTHHVWGATAMMLGEFVSLFDEGFTPPQTR